MAYPSVWRLFCKTPSLVMRGMQLSEIAIPKNTSKAMPAVFTQKPTVPRSFSTSSVSSILEAIPKPFSMPIDVHADTYT